MQKHRFIALLLAVFSLSLAAQRGGTVPGRYIVELSTEPVTEHLLRQGFRPGMLEAATTHRTRVRSEQQRIRGRLASGSLVLGSVDTVANALLVQLAADEPARLKSITGVRRIRPVRTMRMLMDHATSVHQVADAWSQVGPERAGLGIKIGIIDSGVDLTHPAFQDPSLSVPETFPRATSASDLTYTNNKVIVARSYVSMLPVRDPDLSVRDRVGHGTALAMVAAGNLTAGPLATVSGVAPKAYIGNYKVFGTPGINDGASEDAILKAIDDAVADGMDVINLSLGSDLAPRIEDDPLVQAIERASLAGVIVVVAAGNNGPGINTISSPATAPSAISVGASHNERVFAASAEIAALPPMPAIPSSGNPPSSPISAPLADVASTDGTGLACAPLEPGRLRGRIALTLRGECTFETKLNNVMNAGAVAALVYASQNSPEPFAMSVGRATLPAEMISYEDGMRVKQRLAAEAIVNGTLRFTISAIRVDSNRLTSFSARGPSVDRGVKPDLVAVGSDLYVATQKLDPSGDMYDASGFISVNGTSFSSPIVAGAAALLKAARPGLTVDDYRSLLINAKTSIEAVTGDLARVQKAGSGVLDIAASLRGTAVAYPAVINFGTGGPNPRIDRSLRITNVGTTTETFAVFAAPGDGPTPVVSIGTVRLSPGASTNLPVSWTGSGLRPGQQEGFLRVVGTSTGVETRVPYWYGVTSETPAGITVLQTVASARRGATARDAILFRVTDASGLPLALAGPDVSMTSGGGAVRAVVSYDREIPGLYGVTLRLGSAAGANVVSIRAGEAAVNVSITGR